MEFSPDTSTTSARAAASPNSSATSELGVRPVVDVDDPVGPGGDDRAVTDGHRRPGRELHDHVRVEGVAPRAADGAHVVRQQVVRDRAGADQVHGRGAPERPHGERGPHVRPAEGRVGVEAGGEGGQGGHRGHVVLPAVPAGQVVEQRPDAGRPRSRSSRGLADLAEPVLAHQPGDHVGVPAELEVDGVAEPEQDPGRVGAGVRGVLVTVSRARPCPRPGTGRSSARRRRSWP